MKREIQVTADGSQTIVLPELNVSYHSMHGAIGESMHVFIEAGLKFFPASHAGAPMAIFELGFGTGLNALLTFLHAEQNKMKIYYETIDPYPLEADQISLLQYHEQLKHPGLKEIFEQLHDSEWNKAHQINPSFTFKKIKCKMENYAGSTSFNLIYFDAFAPTIQPLLWTTEIFKKLRDQMQTGGILVTYSSKSTVRKAMTEAGFMVTKIPGPYGKREMVRAIAI